MNACRIEIRGVVQGVGFRPWVFALAKQEQVRGRVRNDESGVTIDAWASQERLERFCSRLRTEPPPGAILDRFEQHDLDTVEPAPEDFSIGPSETSEATSRGVSDRRRVSIPPDMATCPQCRAELLDAHDRRHGYPFTNCTHCGPRFTIATDVPYDRPATTMAAFPMCEKCRHEYDSPEDRRFHAQPNACPDCGPRLTLLDPAGRPIETVDPLAETARRLGSGEILAVKGLGGFHLVCLATSDVTVHRLRQRKRRDCKPFAVMVESLNEARQYARTTVTEEDLLAGPESPIVLVRRRGESLAGEIAPGLDRVGLMLPYTPLHHLLMRAVGKPLVMTSANLNGEPIVRTESEALETLGTIADAFLVHDREIAARCDDSVARVVAGAPVLLRRSRGFVPRAILLRRPVERPTLAVGSQLKNTFCIAAGDTAYLGPHIGDLDNLETYEVFCQEVERMQHLIGVAPEIFVHDLHPEYLSTRYALERSCVSDDGDSVRIAVQHHHAHLASAIAEGGLDEEGPVLGLIFDGTGLGTDHTAWGGEILFGDAAEFQRVATLRALPLVGNERAIREPWRLTLALLDDAFHGEAPLERLRLFQQIPREHVELVRQMIRRNVVCPRAHGAGRYFDAVGALVLAHPRARYEGQLAMRLEDHAARLWDPTPEAYSFDIERASDPWEIDLRPAIRAMVEELLAAPDSPAIEARIAARFHATLAASALEVAASWVEGRGVYPARTPIPKIVTSGGCFANAELARHLCRLMETSRVPFSEPFFQRQVPPGDGGIALGQVAVATAALARHAESPHTRSHSHPVYGPEGPQARLPRREEAPPCV